MNCPKCQHENPSDARFCNECGHKLELACPECRKSNPPGSKFCSGCGYNLTLPTEPTHRELSFDEKLKKIQKYLPTGITEKILSQRDRIEGERKQVTVMFCDMEGFTSLSEKFGPEEMYALMDQVYEILIHKVHDYEGTVNEMTGDGIMALFGAPIALEDAPQRAIRSALAIHREISKFSDQLKTEKRIPPLKMRIGIHTGPVVVGTLGNDLRVEFKAVGDTVNLASRMEGLAEAGTTYVTEDTFKLTEGLFRFEALGEKLVKGKEDPVRVYQVIAPSTRRTRFDVSTERGLTPLVGRERELDLLLYSFERAKAGRGQAFSIIAEAGVGKSRLLYEFRKAVANEDVTFLEGKCLSYSRKLAYHPVTDILKSNFDVLETDGDAEVTEKVKRGLKTLGLDEASTLPYFLELLSVRHTGMDDMMMSPEGKKEKINEALQRIVLKGSEVRPLVMAFEDLQWADGNSIEVSKYVLDSIAGARVLLIFTYRPEFVPKWGSKSYLNQLALGRLPNRESLTMVSHLLNAEDVDEHLEQLILEKAEGVPLFIEELTKSLKDLGIIEKDHNKYALAKNLERMTIPSTIQDVIMARIDLLPEGAKEVLQAGSVIEKEFSYRLISRVVSHSEQDLLSNLSTLKASELVYERGIYPESAYVFNHAFTRNVVYDSILSSKKRELHLRAGNAIRDLYDAKLNDQFGILAQHYAAGEDFQSACEFWKFAAKNAAKSASLSDAIAHTRRRIDCLEKLPGTELQEKEIIDARTTLGLYFLQRNDYSDAREAVEPIVELALHRNHKRRISQIFTVLGAYNYAIKEDFDEAFKNLNEALKISEEIQDILSLVMAKGHLATGRYFAGHFSEALMDFEDVLRINEAVKVPWGISITKSFMGMVYYAQGNVPLGHRCSSEALEVANESGDILSRAMASVSHGFSCFSKGILDEAEKHLLAGSELCARLNDLMWEQIANWCLSEIYFEKGEYERARTYCEKKLRSLEQTGSWPSMTRFGKVALARTGAAKGNRDIDVDLVFDYERKNRAGMVNTWLSRYIAEILLKMDEQHRVEAEQWVKKAIKEDEDTAAMWHLGRDYALYGEFFRVKQDKQNAAEQLRKAIEIFRDCGADGWVKRYEEELAILK